MVKSFLEKNSKSTARNGAKKYSKSKGSTPTVSQTSNSNKLGNKERTDKLKYFEEKLVFCGITGRLERRRERGAKFDVFCPVKVSSFSSSYYEFFSLNIMGLGSIVKKK